MTTQFNEVHFAFWQSDNLDNLVSLYRDYLRESDDSPAETPFEDFCAGRFCQCDTRDKYEFCYNQHHPKTGGSH